MSRRRNTKKFYTARKLIEQIDFFTFLESDNRQSARWEQKILASRILTFIQNMSFEELEEESITELKDVIDKAIGGISVMDGMKYSFDSVMTAKKLAKEQAQKEEKTDATPVPAVGKDPRPLIRFDKSTIILYSGGGDWQWKNKGDEFWMPIKQNAMISNGAVQVIDQQTLKVSNILDITREINTKVRQKRRQPFKLTGGPEYDKILAQARKDILAEIQVQTEEIPVSDVGYSFDTVKKNMKKRIIGNPLLANHVSQLFYDRVTQLIIEGKRTDIDVADVLRIFPTIMLQPDQMTKEVLKIRKGFLIKVGPQPTPPVDLGNLESKQPSLTEQEQNDFEENALQVNVARAARVARAAAALAAKEAKEAAALAAKEAKEEEAKAARAAALVAKKANKAKKANEAKAAKVAKAAALAANKAKKANEAKAAKELKIRAAADTAREAREKAAREKVLEEKAAREKAAREKVAREKAAREEAAREKAEVETREKAAREKAAREIAAREKAEVETREKAAREKAAKEKVLEEKAAREKAAREKVAREKAAREEAAREKAAVTIQALQRGNDEREKKRILEEKEIMGPRNDDFDNVEDEEEKAAERSATQEVKNQEQMSFHFLQESKKNADDRNITYMIEYDANEIYGKKTADAMRKVLNDTFSSDEWLKNSQIDDKTTFTQLRPILADLFPMCELHDLTDKQLQESVNGIPTLLSQGFAWGTDFVGYTNTANTESDIANIEKLLTSLLVPDKNNQYQPSTEVLTFEGFVDGSGKTQLLSFKDQNQNPRFFNQDLTENFYKIMTVTTQKNIGKLQAMNLGHEFFIFKNKGILKVFKIENDRAKASSENEAKIKHWKPPLTTSLDSAESHYPSPIPAGELSAMLAELSSMENTSESEYATEEEEFASDSEEFASDDF